MKVIVRALVLVCLSLFAVPAFAEKANDSKDAGSEMGFCVGLATRCGLLPKGICYTQQGCMNPFGPYGGDRCTGTARQCTGFARKAPCMMQRGCTWATQKKKGEEPKAPAAEGEQS